MKEKIEILPKFFAGFLVMGLMTIFFTTIHFLGNDKHQG